MYAKLINEYTIQEAPAYKDGFINYNAESNKVMMALDGYKPVIIDNEPEFADDVLKYSETKKEIIGVYVRHYETIDIDTLKLLQKEKINEARKLAYENSFVTYYGHNYPVDEVFSNKLGSLITLNKSTYIKTIEGEWFELSVEQMKGLLELVVDTNNEIYIYSQELKHQLQKATTKEQVVSIIWNKQFGEEQ